MKLLSWNVNGFRAIMKKGFMDFFKSEMPDIICLQETKTDVFDFHAEGYRQYWNAAKKKGYSGTAVFTKEEPLSKYTEFDSEEGRVLALEFEKFCLVNVYTPNAQRGLLRLDYRMGWDKRFRDYLRSLPKPVIACGDFNVAHQEIDIARPKDNRKNAGFTDEEREGFSNLLESGFIDTFRHLHPDEVKYSWWSYMFNARAKNIGWRLDYFIVSKLSLIMLQMPLF